MFMLRFCKVGLNLFYALELDFKKSHISWFDFFSLVLFKNLNRS